MTQDIGFNEHMYKTVIHEALRIIMAVVCSAVKKGIQRFVTHLCYNFTSEMLNLERLSQLQEHQLRVPATQALFPHGHL